MLQCKPTELDNNEFLLNTPLGTYYLPDGLCGIHPSTATDKITKVTEVSPGDNGKICGVLLSIPSFAKMQSLLSMSSKSWDWLLSEKYT